MWCVGCGERLGDEEEACRACGAPAVGASFSEDVVIRDGQAVRVPWVCCCCLGPNDGTDDHGFTGSSLTGSANYKMTVPIPWCDRCRGTRTSLARMNTIAAVVLGALVFFVSPAFGAGFAGRGFSALMAAFVGVVASSFILPAVLPSLRDRGHVPGCAAVIGNVGRRKAEITFANRGFARIWRDLQAGVECRAPALAWAKVEVPDKPAVAAPPANPDAARKLAGVALRQQAHAAMPAPPVGRHAVPSGAAAASADLMAGVVRFAAKECRFTDAGIEARLVDGGERLVAWTDVTRVRVRQMPQGKPFSAALLLDLVLRAPDGGPPVLRLLASTRANFGVLPGSGVTSQENFRRLAKHVTEKHAGAEIEAQSAPFLREGKAPPRFEGLGQFEAYDAEYG